MLTLSTLPHASTRAPISVFTTPVETVGEIDSGVAAPLEGGTGVEGGLESGSGGSAGAAACKLSLPVDEMSTSRPA